MGLVYGTQCYGSRRRSLSFVSSAEWGFSHVAVFSGVEVNSLRSLFQTYSKGKAYGAEP